MKIIIFTENSRAGGMDSFIKLLIKAWPKKDDTFVLICNECHPGLSRLKKSLSKNVSIVSHSILLNWDIMNNLSFPLPNFLKKFLRFALRVVLAPYQFFALRKLLKDNRGNNLISVNGAYPGGETCRLANIAWNSLGYGKSIHNIHNFAITYRWFSFFYEYPMDYFLARACKFFVGVSNACSESLKVRFAFKNSDIQTIYNGISMSDSLNDDDNLNNYPEIPADEKALLMLAGYESRKGHEFLLKSMREVFEFYPKTHLIICGSGSRKEKNHVKTLVSQIIPNHNVYLLDFIPNPGYFIDKAYAVLIASQEFESFGLTVIEAMQRSTPVISTDIGGLPEVIGKNGVCGFYCPKDDNSIYAEKILYLLENPNIAKTMGLKGLDRVKNIFSDTQMTEKYYDLLII